MLENAGLKGRFIHDESGISWQIKYRPDFWFINENLIVEYDEIAHKLRTKKIYNVKNYQKYIPHILFVSKKVLKRKD